MKKILSQSLTVLLVCSTLQYGDVFVSRYFIPVLGIIYALIVFFMCGPKLNKSQSAVLVTNVFYMFIFSCLSLFGHSTLDESIFDTSKILVAFLLSFFTFYFVSISDSASIRSALRYMFYSVFLFLAIELYGRIEPILDSLDMVVENFYLAKINSPFMYDSNGVGLYALLYFVAYLSSIPVLEHRHKAQAVYIVTFLFFLAFTLSRAAILVSVLILIIFMWHQLPVYIKRCLLLMFFISIIISAGVMLDTLLSDGSGLTKLEVVYNIPNLIDRIDVRGLLFGFGINEGDFVYSYEEGKYGHLLIALLLGEFGIFGMLLYGLYFYIFNKISNGSQFYLIVTIILVGLSYLPPFFETIFLVSALSMGLSYKNYHFRMTA